MDFNQKKMDIIIVFFNNPFFLASDAKHMNLNHVSDYFEKQCTRTLQLPGQVETCGGFCAASGINTTPTELSKYLFTQRAERQ